MMPSLGVGEIAVIAGLVVVLFGAKRLITGGSAYKAFGKQI